jgi:hypothetical protein
MSLFAALAVLVLGQAAEANVADYAAIQAVRADEVVLPITRCAQTKLAALSVKEAEVGSREAAAKALGDSLSVCGMKSGQQELQARLRKTNPSTTPGDTLRQAQTAFALPVVMVLADAMTKFGVQPPPSPPALPIAVPCPREGQLQPQACR